MTKHFWHPDGGRTACGAQAYGTYAVNAITCKRCRKTAAWVRGVEIVREWEEKVAQDEERRSWRGYTPEEMARI